MPSENKAFDQAGEAQRNLVQALRNPACYPHEVGTLSVIETHISFVVLTGPFAYKIKKPVDLGFLDFTTLEKRRFFCHEELRLNGRLAPRIYIEVVPVGGTWEAPRVGGDAQPLEYAVKMLEFPQDALADRVLARGELTPRHIDGLAGLLAQFHACAHRSREADGYGTSAAILDSGTQNFAQIRALPLAEAEVPLLNQVENWTRQEHARLSAVFAERARAGRVRECHGDLHLGNIVLLDDALQAFDCIEFNPALRWIDVMSEIAFLLMDLHAAGRPDLARRFLNGYLERCVDYGGLRVLDFYFAYRAMVRAKISLMRGRQLAAASQGLEAQQESCRRYLALAATCTRQGSGFVAITRGFSGSGKTTLSQPLVELTGAVRIRSDVERKRMNGPLPTQERPAAIGKGLYATDVTDATYRRLLDLAQTIVESGRGVIVDATFLKRRHRDLFRAFAANAHIPFAILDFTAPEALLRERVASRSRQGEDASDADLGVLDHQLRTGEPLQSDELAFVVSYDASRPAADAQFLQSWGPLLQRLPLMPSADSFRATSDQA